MKAFDKILEILEDIKTDIRFVSKASHSDYLDIYNSFISPPKETDNSYLFILLSQ